MNDVVKISIGTTKEDDLFVYVKAPNYLKTIKKSNEEAKNDYEISL